MFAAEPASIGSSAMWGGFSVAFTTDFLRFLVNGPGTIASSSLGATFSARCSEMPITKPKSKTSLQSERDLLYALRTFVLFRKSFSVDVASAYYAGARQPRCRPERVH